MSTPFPERFDNVTIGPDLDLDAEEFYLPSGERLTEQRAQELVASITADRPKVHNWRDVRAEAIESGLIDEQKLAQARAELAEVQRAYRTTFTANITRDGDWWMIHVPEIDGLTQAHQLADAEHMARDLIATTLDVPLDTVNVTTHVAQSEGGGDDPAETI